MDSEASPAPGSLCACSSNHWLWTDVLAVGYHSGVDEVEAASGIQEVLRSLSSRSGIDLGPAFNLQVVSSKPVIHTLRIEPSVGDDDKTVNFYLRWEQPTKAQLDLPFNTISHFRCRAWNGNFVLRVFPLNPKADVLQVLLKADRSQARRATTLLWSTLLVFHRLKALAASQLFFSVPVVTGSLFSAKTSPFQKLATLPLPLIHHAAMKDQIVVKPAEADLLQLLDALAVGTRANFHDWLAGLVAVSAKRLGTEPEPPRNSRAVLGPGTRRVLLALSRSGKSESHGIPEAPASFADVVEQLLKDKEVRLPSFEGVSTTSKRNYLKPTKETSDFLSSMFRLLNNNEYCWFPTLLTRAGLKSAEPSPMVIDLDRLPSGPEATVESRRRVSNNLETYFRTLIAGCGGSIATALQVLAACGSASAIGAIAQLLPASAKQHGLLEVLSLGFEKEAAWSMSIFSLAMAGRLEEASQLFVPTRGDGDKEPLQYLALMQGYSKYGLFRPALALYAAFSKVEKDASEHAGAAGGTKRWSSNVGRLMADSLVMAACNSGEIAAAEAIVHAMTRVANSMKDGKALESRPWTGAPNISHGATIRTYLVLLLGLGAVEDGGRALKTWNELQLQFFGDEPPPPAAVACAITAFARAGEYVAAMEVYHKWCGQPWDVEKPSEASAAAAPPPPSHWNGWVHSVNTTAEIIAQAAAGSIDQDAGLVHAAAIAAASEVGDVDAARAALRRGFEPRGTCHMAHPHTIGSLITCFQAMGLPRHSESLWSVYSSAALLSESGAALVSPNAISPWVVALGHHPQRNLEKALGSICSVTCLANLQSPMGHLLHSVLPALPPAAAVRAFEGNVILPKVQRQAQERKSESNEPQALDVTPTFPRGIVDLTPSLLHSLGVALRNTSEEEAGAESSKLLRDLGFTSLLLKGSSTGPGSSTCILPTPVRADGQLALCLSAGLAEELLCKGTRLASLCPAPSAAATGSATALFRLIDVPGAADLFSSPWLLPSLVQHFLDNRNVPLAASYLLSINPSVALAEQYSISEYSDGDKFVAFPHFTSVRIVPSPSTTIAMRPEHLSCFVQAAKSLAAAGDLESVVGLYKKHSLIARNGPQLRDPTGFTLGVKGPSGDSSEAPYLKLSSHSTHAAAPLRPSWLQLAVTDTTVEVRVHHKDTGFTAWAKRGGVVEACDETVMRALTLGMQKVDMLRCLFMGDGAGAEGLLYNALMKWSESDKFTAIGPATSTFTRLFTDVFVEYLNTVMETLRQESTLLRSPAVDFSPASDECLDKTIGRSRLMLLPALLSHFALAGQVLSGEHVPPLIDSASKDPSKWPPLPASFVAKCNNFLQFCCEYEKKLEEVAPDHATSSFATAVACWGRERAALLTAVFPSSLQRALGASTGSGVVEGRPLQHRKWFPALEQQLSQVSTATLDLVVPRSMAGMSTHQVGTLVSLMGYFAYNSVQPVLILRAVTAAVKGTNSDFSQKGSLTTLVPTLRHLSDAVQQEVQQQRATTKAQDIAAAFGVSGKASSGARPSEALYDVYALLDRHRLSSCRIKYLMERLQGPGRGPLVPQRAAMATALRDAFLSALVTSLMTRTCELQLRRYSPLFHDASDGSTKSATGCIPLHSKEAPVPWVVDVNDGKVTWVEGFKEAIAWASDAVNELRTIKQHSRRLGEEDPEEASPSSFFSPGYNVEVLSIRAAIALADLAIISGSASQARETLQAVHRAMLARARLARNHILSSARGGEGRPAGVPQQVGEVERTAQPQPFYEVVTVADALRLALAYGRAGMAAELEDITDILLGFYVTHPARQGQTQLRATTGETIDVLNGKGRGLATGLALSIAFSLAGQATAAANVWRDPRLTCSETAFAEATWRSMKGAQEGGQAPPVTPFAPGHLAPPARSVPINAMLQDSPEVLDGSSVFYSSRVMALCDQAGHAWSALQLAFACYKLPKPTRCFPKAPVAVQENQVPSPAQQDDAASPPRPPRGVGIGSPLHSSPGPMTPSVLTPRPSGKYDVSRGAVHGYIGSTTSYKGDVPPTVLTPLHADALSALLSALLRDVDALHAAAAARAAAQGSSKPRGLDVNWCTLLSTIECLFAAVLDQQAHLRVQLSPVAVAAYITLLGYTGLPSLVMHCARQFYEVPSESNHEEAPWAAPEVAHTFASGKAEAAYRIMLDSTAWLTGYCQRHPGLRSSPVVFNAVLEGLLVAMRVRDRQSCAGHPSITQWLQQGSDETFIPSADMTATHQERDTEQGKRRLTRLGLQCALKPGLLQEIRGFLQQLMNVAVEHRIQPTDDIVADEEWSPSSAVTNSTTKKGKESETTARMLEQLLHSPTMDMPSTHYLLQRVARAVEVGSCFLADVPQWALQEALASRFSDASAPGLRPAVEGALTAALAAPLLIRRWLFETEPRAGLLRIHRVIEGLVTAPSLPFLTTGSSTPAVQGPLGPAEGDEALHGYSTAVLTLVHGKSWLEDDVPLPVVAQHPIRSPMSAVSPSVFSALQNAVHCAQAAHKRALKRLSHAMAARDSEAAPSFSSPQRYALASFIDAPMPYPATAGRAEASEAAAAALSLLRILRSGHSGWLRRAVTMTGKWANALMLSHHPSADSPTPASVAIAAANASASELMRAYPYGAMLVQLAAGSSSKAAAVQQDIAAAMPDGEPFLFDTMDALFETSTSLTLVNPLLAPQPSQPNPPYSTSTPSKPEAEETQEEGPMYVKLEDGRFAPVTAEPQQGDVLYVKKQLSDGRATYLAHGTYDVLSKTLVEDTRVSMLLNRPPRQFNVAYDTSATLAKETVHSSHASSRGSHDAATSSSMRTTHMPLSISTAAAAANGGSEQFNDVSLSPPPNLSTTAGLPSPTQSERISPRHYDTKALESFATRPRVQMPLPLSVSETMEYPGLSARFLRSFFHRQHLHTSPELRQVLEDISEGKLQQYDEWHLTSQESLFSVASNPQLVSAAASVEAPEPNFIPVHQRPLQPHDDMSVSRFHGAVRSRHGSSFATQTDALRFSVSTATLQFATEGIDHSGKSRDGTPERRHSEADGSSPLSGHSPSNLAELLSELQEYSINPGSDTLTMAPYSQQTKGSTELQPHDIGYLMHVQCSAVYDTALELLRVHNSIHRSIAKASIEDQRLRFLEHVVANTMPGKTPMEAMEMALLSLQHGLEQRCGILREKIAVADAGSLMEHLLQRFDSTQLSIANAGERLEEDLETWQARLREAIGQRMEELEQGYGHPSHQPLLRTSAVFACELTLQYLEEAKESWRLLQESLTVDQIRVSLVLRRSPELLTMLDTAFQRFSHLSRQLEVVEAEHNDALTELSQVLETKRQTSAAVDERIREHRRFITHELAMHAEEEIRVLEQLRMGIAERYKAELRLVMEQWAERVAGETQKAHRLMEEWRANLATDIEMQQDGILKRGVGLKGRKLKLQEELELLRNELKQVDMQKASEMRRLQEKARVTVSSKKEEDMETELYLIQGQFFDLQRELNGLSTGAQVLMEMEDELSAPSDRQVELYLQEIKRLQPDFDIKAFEASMQEDSWSSDRDMAFSPVSDDPTLSLEDIAGDKYQGPWMSGAPHAEGGYGRDAAFGVYRSKEVSSFLSRRRPSNH